MKALIVASVIFCLALIGGAYYIVTRPVEVPPRILELDPSYQQRVELGGWVRGNVESANRVVEYGDLQCPGCAGLHPTFNATADALAEEDVAFVYRHFPLTAIHDKAVTAALAAEAAGRQGMFWEMQSILFEQQASWSSQSPSRFRSTLRGYAEQLGLNMEQYDQDLKDPSLKAEVNKDREAGDALNIQSTPSVFVNDQALGFVPASPEQFANGISRILNPTEAEQPAGDAVTE